VVYVLRPPIRPIIAYNGGRVRSRARPGLRRFHACELPCAALRFFANNDHNVSKPKTRLDAIWSWWTKLPASRMDARPAHLVLVFERYVEEFDSAEGYAAIGCMWPV